MLKRSDLATFVELARIAQRLIVATALAGHRLVTSDRRILEWSERLSRLDATE